MNTGTRLKPGSRNLTNLTRLMRRKRIKKFLQNAINKLDRDDYEILYELYFNNTSIHQLSKKLAISRSTVRYKRDRALKQLKKKF